jgi:hypothetical protein
MRALHFYPDGAPVPQLTKLDRKPASAPGGIVRQQSLDQTNIGTETPALYRDHDLFHGPYDTANLLMKPAPRIFFPWVARERLRKDLVKGTVSGVAGGVAGAVTSTLLAGGGAATGGAAAGATTLSFGAAAASGAAAGSAFPVVGTIIGAAAGIGVYLLTKKKKA